MNTVKHKKLNIFMLDVRRLSVLVLAFFAAWLFTIPFEGKILYALLDRYQVSSLPFVLGSIVAHSAGLLLCGFFVKSMRSAKRLMLISIAYCAVASAVFFFPPSNWWYAALFSSSFTAGFCVASWGYFLKSGTPKTQRSKTIAEMLALSYILLLLLVKASIAVSAQVGVALAILPLGIMFLLCLRLPPHGDTQSRQAARSQENHVSIGKPLFFLCLFIVIVAINVGLMYQVQFPAFAHLEQLTSWYWAVPYIAGVMVVRYLPSRVKRAHILYAAIAMTGFSFIGFMLLDRSALSYLFVHTLMFGAVGIFNLFWWTMLGEMLEFHENSARIMGSGLFANVLGILLGELIAGALGSGRDYPSLLALAIVCVTLVMLPPLYARLTGLLRTHEYLTEFSGISRQERNRLISESAMAGKLTARETEIALLLTRGITYRTAASDLHISENTVRFHVKNIYSKYAVRSRAEFINAVMAEKIKPDA
ncbi:MAG: LuxR family transcriptional regulator [Clostridiales bacterium]|nr:LuxR family transcriptional regulator [Clostridiales bacterium]